MGRSSGTCSAECEMPVILHKGGEVRGVEVRPTVTSARTHRQRFGIPRCSTVRLCTPYTV